MAKATLHPNEYTMSFGDHLDELRRRVLLSLAAPLPLFVVAFLFSDTLLGWFLLPVYHVLGQHGLPVELQAISPTEVLLTKLKLSLILAVVVTAPWILWQMWLFIAPGLHHHERRFVYFLIPGSAILTAAGLTLLYYVMLPLMLHVLVAFGTSLEVDPGGPRIDPRVEAVLADGGSFEVRTAPPNDLEVGARWLLVPDMTVWVAVPVEAGGGEGAGAGTGTGGGADTGTGTDAGTGTGADAGEGTDAGAGAGADAGTGTGAGAGTGTGADAGTGTDAGADVGTGDVAIAEAVELRPTTPGRIDQSFRVMSVINFTLVMMLSIVVAFQMPLVILLLGWVGIVSPETLSSKRRYALVVCGIVSAMITPADALSMLMMLIPLYGLYELGILLLRVAPAGAVAEGRLFRGRAGDAAPASVTPRDGAVARGDRSREDES